MATATVTESRGEKALVEVGRAVFTALDKRLPGHVAKSLQPVQDRLTTLEGSLESRLKSLQADTLAVFGSVLHRELQAQGKSLEASFNKRLEDQAVAHAKQLTAIQQGHEARLEVMRKAYESGQLALLELVKNLPVPQFSVPAEAIKVSVEQSTPQVHLPEGAIRVEVQQAAPQVTLPEGAITVHVDQAAPHVTLPVDAIKVFVEQSTPQVHIPEGAIKMHVDVSQPAPQVHIPAEAIHIKQLPAQVHIPAEAIRVEAHIPPPRRLRREKSIIYSQQTGRPERLVEEETELEEV